MISKKIVRCFIKGLIVIMLLIQLIMFIKTSECFCLSSDIEIWSKYGTSFSAWSLPFLTSINALALFLVDNQLTANMEIDVLKDNKFKVQYAKFETFRTNFMENHRQLQEAIGIDNQQACYDNWKACFYDFYNQMSEISPSIKNCNCMKWWENEFESHTKIINFTPEGKYNPAVYSYMWTTNISKMYSELCNFILSGK